jgi:hypothetical protein
MAPRGHTRSAFQTVIALRISGSDRHVHPFAHALFLIQWVVLSRTASGMRPGQGIPVSLPTCNRQGIQGRANALRCQGTRRSGPRCNRATVRMKGR